MSFNPSEDEWGKFSKYIASMPHEEMERKNQEHLNEVEQTYKQFKEAFQNGDCDTCKKPLATFSRKTSCFHWLLRPNGVKKADLESLLTQKGYFRIAAYVRWVANQEAFLRQINDLTESEQTRSVFHWSASYKHIKWTFICSQNDYKGHLNTLADFPHFHFEMRLAGQPFVRFNDFHVRFSDEDLFNIKCNESDSFPIKQSFGSYGAGMKDAFSLPAKTILEQSTSTDNEGKAVYHIQTIVQSDSGISGEKIAEIMRLSKETKKPMTQLFYEAGLKPQVLIQPPDSIPDKENRNPRRKMK